MSQTTTAGSLPASQPVTPTPPLLSTQNVTGSPGTTALALGYAGTFLTQLATAGLPATPVGWVGIGANLLVTLLGLFGRA